MFTWIALYQEIARKLLTFEHRQGELLALLRGFAEQGLQVGSLKDENTPGNSGPLTEIDPFSFFATFNWQGHKPEKRRAILGALREAWQLTAAVPEDFDGIPLGNPQQLWFFGWQHRRDPGDIGRLWEFARQVLGETRATIDRALFTRLLAQRSVGEVKLSIGMFWLNPREFLPADKWMRGYMERHGVPGEVWNGDAWLNANPKIWDFRHVAVVQKDRKRRAARHLGGARLPRRSTKASKVKLLNKSPGATSPK